MAGVLSDTMISGKNLIACCGSLLLLAANAGFAQGRGGAAQAPKTPRAAAPFDVTGYWVSMVTEDWRYRMVTPPKGDYAALPLKPETRKLADAWDPAKDEAAGEQCRSYGAVNIMRVPGRFHITWQDDETLKMETDAGMQTRLFSFGEPRSPGGDWQGISTASWELVPAGRGQPPASASLKIVTTKMKPGYLRKNGVPYSANAVLTEYYDRLNLPDGNSFLVLTATLDDPAFLTQPFITSTSYQKQPDAAGWNPAPCTAR
jgi:hypothetical protein